MRERDDGGEKVGRDGGEEGDGGGGDVRVGEVEVGYDAGDDGVPEVGGKTRGGADEIECELFTDGGGGGGDNLFDGGFGDDGGVAAGGGLLESLEKGAGLTESVVGTEVGLDLGEEYVHFSFLGVSHFNFWSCAAS